MKALIGAAALAILCASTAVAAPGGLGGIGASARLGQTQATPVKAAQAQSGPAKPQPAPNKGAPGASVSSPAPTNKPTDPIVARYTAVYDGCMHKAVSTNDMLDCAGKEADRWDARLNRAYKARMAVFNNRQKDALVAAEKAWLVFRRSDCAAYEDEDWGSVSRIDASQCFLRRTVERTLELESFPTDHGPG